MERVHDYLTQGPDDLLELCDVLLKLDDGTELPAHKLILAQRISVFYGMVAEGPLSKATVENVVSVPFSECSLEEAEHFLAALYSPRPEKCIDSRFAAPIARLSHKYGLKVGSLQDHTGLLTDQ